MFNEEQKRRFIDNQLVVSVSSNKKNLENGLIRYFNRLSPLEEQYGLDIASMSRKDIFDIMGKFLTGSSGYQDTTLSIITQYLDWCILNNISFNKENVLIGKSLKDFDVDDTRKFVRNEEELIIILDEVLSPLQEDKIDNLYRAYLLLIYTGLTPDEALMLRTDQIDFDEKEINWKGRRLFLSNVSNTILKYCVKMSYYYRIGKGNSVREDVIIRNGYVLENTVSIDYKVENDYRYKMKKTLDSAISKKLSNCSKNINPSNIFYSGIFGRMYLIETQTGQIDCSEYMESKKYNTVTIEYPNRIFEACRHEYSMWKKAFDLI